MKENISFFGCKASLCLRERVRESRNILDSCGFLRRPSPFSQACLCKKRGSEAFSRCARSRWDFFLISLTSSKVYFFVSPKNRKHTEAESFARLEEKRKKRTRVKIICLVKWRSSSCYLLRTYLSSCAHRVFADNLILKLNFPRF